MDSAYRRCLGLKTRAAKGLLVSTAGPMKKSGSGRGKSECNLLRKSRSCSKRLRAIGIAARTERKGRSHVRLGADGAVLVMACVLIPPDHDGEAQRSGCAIVKQGSAAFKNLATLLTRAATSGLDLLATLTRLFAPADAGRWERRDHRQALRARHRERSVGLDGRQFAVR